MAVSDYSGQAWFSGFNDVGETIFGMPADELVDIRVNFAFHIYAVTYAHRRPQERDDSQFNQVVERAIGTTYNFACRAKQDSYNVCPRSPDYWMKLTRSMPLRRQRVCATPSTVSCPSTTVRRRSTSPTSSPTAIGRGSVGAQPAARVSPSTSTEALNCSPLCLLDPMYSTSLTLLLCTMKPDPRLVRSFSLFEI